MMKRSIILNRIRSSSPADNDSSSSIMYHTNEIENEMNINEISDVKTVKKPEIF